MRTPDGYKPSKTKKRIRLIILLSIIPLSIAATFIPTTRMPDKTYEEVKWKTYYWNMNRFLNKSLINLGFSPSIFISLIFLFLWQFFSPPFTGLRLDPPYWYFIRYFCISISILFLSDAFKNYFKCIKRKKPLGCLSEIFLIINFFCFLFVLFFEYIFFP